MAVALERALSKLGLASRSEARQLIHDGRVTVNGRVVTDARTPVVPERAKIAVDGHIDADARTARTRPRIVIAFHKPRGVMTTTKDPEGRETVFDVLRRAGVSQRVLAVGRLDRASTGLLLFTDDPDLANQLTDPDSNIERVYSVTVRGLLSPEDAAALPARVTVRKSSQRETHVMVTLLQGKNREIRRMFEAVGHEVSRLHRVSYGPISLDDLQPGQWRDVADMFTA